MKKPLKLPKFKNENEEKDFWAKFDPSEYFEPEDAVQISYPNLKPTTRPLSIRLPVYLINGIKELANSADVPYQVLIKQKLAELLEDRSTSRAAR